MFEYPSFQVVIDIYAGHDALMMLVGSIYDIDVHGLTWYALKEPAFVVISVVVFDGSKEFICRSNEVKIGVYRLKWFYPHEVNL